MGRPRVRTLTGGEASHRRTSHITCANDALRRLRWTSCFVRPTKAQEGIGKLGVDVRPLRLGTLGPSGPSRVASVPDTELA